MMIVFSSVLLPFVRAESSQIVDYTVYIKILKSMRIFIIKIKSCYFPEESSHFTHWIDSPVILQLKSTCPEMQASNTALAFT